MAVTTVSGGYFPTVDITHKPKRMQGANVSGSDAVVPDGVASVDVPTSLTLESLIRFYKDNAVGPYRAIYSQTASILEDMIPPKNRKAVYEPEEH